MGAVRWMEREGPAWQAGSRGRRDALAQSQSAASWGVSRAGKAGHLLWAPLPGAGYACRPLPPQASDAAQGPFSFLCSSRATRACRVLDLNVVWEQTGVVTPGERKRSPWARWDFPGGRADAQHLCLGPARVWPGRNPGEATLASMCKRRNRRVGVGLLGGQHPWQEE